VKTKLIHRLKNIVDFHAVEFYCTWHTVNEQIGLNLSCTCPVLLIIKLETIVVNMLSLFIGASLKLNAFYKKIFLKKSHIFTKCIIIPVMADF